MNRKSRIASYHTLALVLFGAALSTASPYGIGLVIDGVSTRSIDQLKLGIILFLGLELAFHVLGFFRMRKRETIFQNCFSYMPMRITELFFARPLCKLLDEDSEIDGGGIESLRDKIWNVLVSYIFNIIPNFSFALFGVGACLFVNVYLGLIVLVFVCIDTLVGTRTNKYIQNEMKPIIDGFRRWNRRTREWWNATPLIKANGVERRVIGDVVEEVKEPLKGDKAVWIHYFPFAIIRRRMISLCFQVCVYGLGIFWTWQGIIATEEFVLLFFSFERVVYVLQEISDVQRDVQHNLVSIDKYREVLTEKLDFTYDEGESFSGTDLGIQLEGVHLSYGTGKSAHMVLRDVSCSIEPGECIGVVGPSGAGKSQLVNLMLRGTDPDSGKVYVNGKDLRTLSLQSLIRHIGIIPQKSELFEDSIAGNVTFGVSHLDWERMVLADDVESRIWEAIEKAGLDFGKQLPKGLNTMIGYRGMRLSGGQQQRLMIAQAHFKQPMLVIADEATASLDSLSEIKVLKHLYDSLPSETTMIMIAHRLSTLQNCEKIIFVRPLDLCGESEQVTTHASMEELYRTEPLFRKMADAQGFHP